MCIAIVCKPSCDVMNVEVNLVFLIQPLFLHDQKVSNKNYSDKNFDIFRTKKAFKIK